jgi:hypothetical protein
VNEDTVMFFQNLKMKVERFRTKILFSDEATLQMPGHGNRNNAKILRPAIRRQRLKLQGTTPRSMYLHPIQKI